MRAGICNNLHRSRPRNSHSWPYHIPFCTHYFHNVVDNILPQRLNKSQFLALKNHIHFVWPHPLFIFNLIPFQPFVSFQFLIFLFSHDDYLVFYASFAFLPFLEGQPLFFPQKRDSNHPDQQQAKKLNCGIRIRTLFKRLLYSYFSRHQYSIEPGAYTHIHHWPF